MCSTFFVSAKHFPPSRGFKRGHLPSRVFAVSSSIPPPCRWSAGSFSHDFSLVFVAVFPFISTRARLAIVLFLWLVCCRAFFFPPLPHRRYAGGFDEWRLPCCRVGFSFYCFFSRVPGSIARPVDVREWILRICVLDSFLLRRTRFSPNIPNFCICGSSGWASFNIQPLKAYNNPYFR